MGVAFRDMKRRRSFVVSLGGIVLVTLAAGCGSSDTGGALDGSGAPPLREGATTVPPGATVLVADLSGEVEVPGPGAVNGSGTVRLLLTPDGQVCAEITTAKIEAPTAAHVHTGPKGTAGPVAITLPTPKDGRATGCVTAPSATVAMFAANPPGGYVNIHTGAQPNGAIRGQLVKA